MVGGAVVGGRKQGQLCRAQVPDALHLVGIGHAQELATLPLVKPKRGTSMPSSTDWR